MLDGLVYVVNIRGRGCQFGVLGRYEADAFPALAALRRLRANLESIVDEQERNRAQA